MKTVTGYLLIYGYVCLLVAISLLAKKLKVVGEEGCRKLINVMLFVTWILGTRFDNRIHFVIMPVTFIIINYIILKKKLIPGMYRENDNSYGSVFYVVSLAMMNLAICANESFLIPAGIGAFALAFGDGFASIFGAINCKYNISLKKNRSLFGSLACLVSSFIGIWLVCLILHADVPVSWMVLFSFVSMIMELIGGKYDNLTVPLGVFAI